MVFALIQARFGDWGEEDKRRVKAEFMPGPGQFPEPAQSEDDSGSISVAIDMLSLGVAIGLGLLMLLAVVAGPLGLDRHTVAPSALRALLPGAVLAAGVLWLLNDRLLTEWRERHGEPPNNSRLEDQGLELPRWFGAAPASAAVIWLVIILVLSGGPIHLPLLGILVGLIVFGFALSTLVATPLLLQMLTPSAGQKALCLMAASALGLGGFWFVSFGIWQVHAPLAGGWLAGTAVCTFAATAAIYASAGHSLTIGLPRGDRSTQYVLSREASRAYVVLDAMNLGVVFLIGVGLPLYAATRDQALHASSLNVVASMVFLPGLLSAIFWGLHNWRDWEQLNETASEHGVAWPIYTLSDGNWQKAKQLDERRAKRFRTQLRLNRYSMLMLMPCGLSYLVYVLLTSP
jgi:hypothetical protein